MHVTSSQSSSNEFSSRSSSRRSPCRVLVLQIRAATFEPQDRIEVKWSGSFEHVDFNQQANDYQVRLKPQRFSG
jgi:hypothetical protein